MPRPKGAPNKKDIDKIYMSNVKELRKAITDKCRVLCPAVKG